MKAILLLVAALLLVGASQPVLAAGTSASAPVFAFAFTAQPDLPNIDVDINTNNDPEWYGNPVWLAIGGLAVLFVVVLIVLASRSGGTTIVKS